MGIGKLAGRLPDRQVVPPGLALGSKHRLHQVEHPPPQAIRGWLPLGPAQTDQGAGIGAVGLESDHTRDSGIDAAGELVGIGGELLTRHPEGTNQSRSSHQAGLEDRSILSQACRRRDRRVDEATLAELQAWLRSTHGAGLKVEPLAHAPIHQGEFKPSLEGENDGCGGGQFIAALCRPGGRGGRAIRWRQELGLLQPCFQLLGGQGDGSRLPAWKNDRLGGQECTDAGQRGIPPHQQGRGDHVLPSWGGGAGSGGSSLSRRRM